ncbi:hypothetical protein BJ322DRAFT_439174 [Thelephora terrestris]|uniref:Glutaminase n=1 Tax=Thelephora terrestris TaxID=56493 RepID=A0A9P6LC05_9AGAM|nr:hypothetical protein BJ322DRAFT_439174 [Thelephora terrestris]
MLPHPLSFLQLLFAASFAFAQNWTVTPFIPPATPLAVRGPYLQSWMNQGVTNGSLNSGWQSYRDGSKLTWTGFLRVDGQLFDWMGDRQNYTPAVQKETVFTSTKTVITMTCGSVDLTATFLSPIEPTDLVNQSIPLSYLGVEVASNDGNPHQVELFTDIDGEWLAQPDQFVQWNTTVGDVVTHQFSLQNQTQFGEVNGRLRYGSIVYSTEQVPGLTYQAGAAGVVKPAFQTTGALNNSVDPQFRVIQNNWPTVAFAHNLGTVLSTKTPPIVYTIGYVRDPLVQFPNLPNVNNLRGPYYLTRYNSISNMITAFLNDYTNALARATDFDNKLFTDALDITPQVNDYANILALSVRQMFGNIELTSGWDGTTYVQTDIMAFLNDGFTNAVDIIYSAWPALLYTNPAIGRYLLEPLLAYQLANPVQGGYAIHDLGASYPNVTGSSIDYPVEASGDQLIMALSYTQKTSDNTLITKYQSLYDQFGTYLTQNGLYMASQFSSDSFAGALPNQTNLAVKSIVALKAASEIFLILGDTNKSQHYDSVSASFLTQWQNVALSLDKSHYTLSYRNDPSWSLLYNLYADRLLGLNVFPPSVYQTQTKWYATKLDQYGIRLDSRSSDAKTDWQLWTAATVTDSSLRTTMISLVKKYVTSGINSGPFPDRYNSVNGQMATFMDRTVVGGHFALLIVPDVMQGGSSGGNGTNGSNNDKSGGVSTAVSPPLTIAFTLLATIIYTLL